MRVNTNMLWVDKDSCTYPDERRHSMHSNFPVSCQLQTTAVTLVACRSYKLYPKFILAGGKKRRKLDFADLHLQIFHLHLCLLLYWFTISIWHLLCNEFAIFVCFSIWIMRFCSFYINFIWASKVIVGFHFLSGIFIYLSTKYLGDRVIIFYFAYMSNPLLYVIHFKQSPLSIHKVVSEHFSCFSEQKGLPQ